MVAPLIAAAGIMGATSIAGSIFGSRSASKAARAQADALKFAGHRTKEGYTQARRDILNRINPALADFQQQIKELQAQVVGGRNESLATIRDAFDRTSQQLTQTGQLATSALMGQRPTTRAAPTRATTQPAGATQAFIPEGMGGAAGADIPMVQDPETGQFVPATEGMGGAAMIHPVTGQPLQPAQLPQATGRPEFTSGFYGAGAQVEAGRDLGTQALRRGYGTARQDITAGEEASLGTIAAGRERAIGAYDPYLEYGESAAQQEAALSGALGPEAQQKAIDAFIESPGQKYLRERQEQALLRSSAATGGLGGGRVLTALQEQAMGIAATQQQQHLQNLGTIAGRGAGLVGERGSLLAGFTGQETNVQQQAAAARAGLSERLGVSEAELETMSASQLAQLAQNAGLAQAEIQQAIGMQQAGLLQSTAAQKLGVKQTANQQLVGLGQLAAQTGLQTQTGLATTLGDLSWQHGVQQGGLTAGQGAATAAGIAQSGAAWQQGLQGLGSAAAFGLAASNPNTTATAGSRASINPYMNPAQISLQQYYH